MTVIRCLRLAPCPTRRPASHSLPMCGRYTQTAAGKVLRDYFGPLFDSDELDEKGFAPRFNLCPGQDAPVILNDGRRALKLLRWGLVPFWAKDEKAGYKMINARAEKPAFKGAFERRRCLVPAVDSRPESL